MNQTTPHNRITGLSFIGLMHLGCWVVLFCSLAPLLSAWFWSFDLLSSFRLQYLVLSVLCLVVFGLVKHRLYCFMATLSLLLNAWWVLPVMWTETEQGVHQHTLKLFHANVYTANTAHQELIDQIQREQPDIIILQETDSIWLQALQVLKKQYPHHMASPRPDNFGMALFSKIPLHQQQVHHWTHLEIPSFQVGIQLAGQPINILATHPPPPVNRYYFQAIAQQFEAMAQIIQATPNQAHIIIGDLNTTVWSKNYAILDEIPQMRNTSPGIYPTWPTQLLPMMIAIDHCLVSDHWQVLDFSTGSGFGSDHWPLIVTLGL